MKRRLFTFGCSFTNYKWQTWADIIGTQFEEFQNWGKSGAGNFFISSNLYECHSINKITKDDVVLIMFSSIDRFDFINQKSDFETNGSVYGEYHSLYGDFVFKNIPVVVKSFQIDLPQDTNYISTTVGQSFSATGLSGPVSGARPGVNTFLNNTSRLAGLAGALGRADIALGLTGVALAASTISGLQNAANSNGSGIAAGPAATGGFQGASHVPAKSTMIVTLLPIYSRESMRKFNLADFIGGKYVGNRVGYI
jgi:hypothetical protein